MRANAAEGAPDEPIPLVGRRQEIEALTAALRARKSCLVVGPSGIGKTRLLREAVRAAGQPALSLEGPGPLHGLLVDLARLLGCSGGRSGDGRHATSIALKPAILAELRRTPHCLVLDCMADADPRMFRFLQQVYYLPHACVVVAAKSRGSLGHLRKLLWDPREEIALKPLKRQDSMALFEAGCRAFRLEALDLDDFGPNVLAAAQGNPGQILTMCRMASQPQYQAGRHIKFRPLRIDSLAAFV